MNMRQTQGVDRRPYSMETRRAAAAATTDRILDVARRRFATMPFDQVALAEVAAEANAGVQTLLRRFSSKEDLLIAVAQRRSTEIRAVRDASAVGDPPTALHDLIDSYERFGDEVLPLLAQENRNPVVAAIVQTGRDYHHAWVQRIWSSALGLLAKRERKICQAQLVAATDLYTWKICRRDIGLDRRSTERAMVDLCSKIVGSVGGSDSA